MREENAGLVSRTRRATARLSHLEAELDVTTWLARYQRFWDESHERRDELLATLQSKHADDPGRKATNERIRRRVRRKSARNQAYRLSPSPATSTRRATWCSRLVLTRNCWCR